MDIIEKIKNAGIVGLGGAGFPTHIKLKTKPEYLIINGAECEPLLRNDRYIMKHFADKLVNAIDTLNAYYGGIRCIFATKLEYKEETKALQDAIEKAKSKAEIFLLKAYYPAGDEQLIVYEVTDRVVPSGGIPLDVGCVVCNVATLYSINNAISGIPLTKKFITVTGEVKNPTVIRVPIGTSFSECIKLAGGANLSDYMVISGGPMMGMRMSREEAMDSIVTKTTSGIILISLNSRIANLENTTLEHIKNRAKSSCIQCSYCTEMCPRNLLGLPIEPHKIMRKLIYADDIRSMLDDESVQAASICCQCGVCELYACPMGLQPRTVISVVRQELIKKGIRFEKGKGQKDVSEFRDVRNIPSKRAAARAEVIDYYYSCGTNSIMDYMPKSVRILLKQGIGKASEAVVRSGDSVKLGQLIAECKDGVGNNLHATIDGRVKVYDDMIIIN